MIDTHDVEEFLTAFAGALAAFAAKEYIWALFDLDTTVQNAAAATRRATGVGA